MLRQPIMRLASATARPSLASTLTPRISTRTFTSLPSLRPSLSSSFARPTLFTPQATTPTMATPDLVPQTAISANPAFLAAQVRCGPRNTMQANSRKKRKRKFGFLARNRSKPGRKVLLRRREKRRCRLSN